MSWHLFTKAYLPVELPLVQQLCQPVFPQRVEVLVFDRVAGCLYPAQQQVLQPPLLKNSQIRFHQLLKEIPVALGAQL